MENTKKRFGLSKSKLTSFDICRKRLWLSVHKRDLAVQDPASQMRLDAGNDVGQIACSLLPDGVMVSDPTNLSAALQETRDLLESGHSAPIFEATFSHDNVLVQVDILEPAEDGAWHVAEVKSASSVKEYHVADLATQTWVLRQTGLRVASTAIRYINRDFVLEEPGQFQGLFVDKHLSAELDPIIEKRPETVNIAREMLAGPEPEQEMGNHCTSPFQCEFQDYCSRNLPPLVQWPISLLPRTGAKLAQEWAAHGKFDLSDISAADLKNPIHQIIHAATISGEPYVDRSSIKQETSNWAWPRHFLDFETIAFTIPRWLGTRPNQAIPFQFSCHTQQEDGQVSHTEFLNLDNSDPRRACAEKLIACLKSEQGNSGAIIAYNASVERKAIRELASACPEYAAELEAIEQRVVDLLPVVRNHYYHRDQRGSWSIKNVLPTLGLGLGYGELEVGDGMAAQESWVHMIKPGTPAQEIAQIRDNLLAYCKLDTLAMVKLMQHLLGEASGLEQ